jgi:hypothetical protein
MSTDHLESLSYDQRRYHYSNKVVFHLVSAHGDLCNTDQKLCVVIED